MDISGDGAGNSGNGLKMREKNTLRIGKVSGIDYENGMMQVVYTDKGKAVTSNMPYANFNNEYSMPQIGEQVLVAHMSNGSSRGVVLGGMWNRKNTPEESGKGLYRKELSKTRGAAYMRYEDESGEYLIAVPILKLHGVDRTDLEGPEVNIAANHRTSFESPEHIAAMQMVTIKGMEEADIEIIVVNSVKITMEKADLEALVRNGKMEILEGLELKVGGDLKIDADEKINLAAGGDIEMEDKEFSSTFSEIMERLEALDGNKGFRK